jgi:MraZ protein
MASFFGEYEIALDAKGRCLLPADLRKQFGEGEGDCFIMNRGFNGCINLYTPESWAINYEKVNALDEWDEEAVTFKRLFLSGATRVEVDSADRILIPKNLQETAHIRKDIILMGFGSKLELWDKESYHNFYNNNSDNYSKLAKAVMVKKPDNQSKTQ